MNKIRKLLNQRKNILSIYFTAEFPRPNTTQEVITALCEAGAHIIEVGMPFSDPLADGVVIQKSSQKALENGFRVDKLFDDLAQLAGKTKDVPLLLMGYFNTVLVYGVEKFLQNCQKVGVDTLILPDLPFEVYERQYKQLFERYGVALVFLITPQTTLERVRHIEALSEAFIYAVADNSITGKVGKFSEKQLAYLKRLEDWKLKTPILVGFGISDKETFDTVCEYAHGAIIGSAYIRALEKEEDIKQITQSFIGDFL